LIKIADANLVSYFSERAFVHFSIVKKQIQFREAGIIIKEDLRQQINNNSEFRIPNSEFFFGFAFPGFVQRR